MVAWLALVASAALAGASPADAAPADSDYSSELVFPLNAQHNHAPGLVELPNGDLLASWYRGSGERSADDVAVLGARRPRGSKVWSEPFVMADTPGFPDCNTCMIVDRQQRLWLFWPVILANTWESCLTRYQYSSQWDGSGPPKWTDHGTILLKPDDFHDEAIQVLEGELQLLQGHLSDKDRAEIDGLKKKLGEKLYQRLGWQPRCKPTILPSGRILLPLYSDTYSISIMAISDDEGRTWKASKPLLGFGNIQPSVLRKKDGTLVAYMRENGPRQKIRVSQSSDSGDSWGPVGMIDLPNPGSGLDAVGLADGRWVLVYNDTRDGRSSLAVSLSADEGKTWKPTRHLEKESTGSYHYPCIIQAKDGSLHCIYSYFVAGGKSMKHAAFNPSWIERSPEE
jgi:predicted neuraminidase